MEKQAKPQTKWTIKDILEWTSAYFKSKGIATPRLDAEVLLAYSLGVDRLHLYLNLDRLLLSAERLKYRELVRRRAAREPVAMIIGKKEFWSLPFRVAPGVLIPRPDTEILVEAVLREIRDNPAPKVLEIGTGSGAVAIAIVHEHPGAIVMATDISWPALEIAKFNAKQNNVNVAFFISDLYGAIRPNGSFDVICSNPPYIPDDVIPTLEPEINFEPLTALKGGPDGLDVIRRIISDARDYIKQGGSLLLEINYDQNASVRSLFSDFGFSQVKTIFDLSGKPRVVKGRVSK